LLLHGPPGTGKVLNLQFLVLTLSSIFHHLKSP
jgi:ATP-dependent 26S proteasome regulatory subunit